MEFVANYYGFFSWIDGLIWLLLLLNIGLQCSVTWRWSTPAMSLPARRKLIELLIDLFPLLGICGTVIGLVNSLAFIGQNPQALADLGSVTARFAMALTTTFAGILAVIIALTCRRILGLDKAPES